MRYLLLTLGFLQSSSLLAENAVTVYCKNQNERGLYEQCEEVSLLGQTDKTVRAYSKSSHQVLTIARHEVFTVEEANRSPAMSAGTFIAVPANLLWNNSSNYFFSLCSVAKYQSKKISLDCGLQKNQSVDARLVYRLKPYFAKTLDKRESLLIQKNKQPG